jgi:hypothetical protein
MASSVCHKTLTAVVHQAGRRWAVKKRTSSAAAEHVRLHLSKGLEIHASAGAFASYKESTLELEFDLFAQYRRLS